MQSAFGKGKGKGMGLGWLVGLLEPRLGSPL